MTKEEINNLADNMSGEEKDMMFGMILESVEFEEFRKQKASWFALKDIPYKMLDSEKVPYTPLMRNFLYTFEFCRHRNIVADDFDDQMLAIEMENYDKQRQELLELFVFCNKQKKLHFDSNPAFTDIDFNELNQHLYNDYHIYLSAADCRKLNTVGSIINHIIYRLKDGNGSL